MSLEKAIADSEANGLLDEKTAKWLRSVYFDSMNAHGDEVVARRTTLDLFIRILEARRSNTKTPVRSVDQPENFFTKDFSRTMLRLLTATIGAILGGLAATAAVFGAIYAFVGLMEVIFGSIPSRVRVPIKGIILVVLAPIGGAVLGALYGWTFDSVAAESFVAKWLNRTSVSERLLLIMTLLWTTFSVLSLFFLNPLQRFSYQSIGPRDVFWSALYCIGPILGIWLAIRVVSWVLAGRRE